MVVRCRKVVMHSATASCVSLIEASLEAPLEVPLEMAGRRANGPAGPDGPAGPAGPGGPAGRDEVRAGRAGGAGRGRAVGDGGSKPLLAGLGRSSEGPSEGPSEGLFGPSGASTPGGHSGGHSGEGLRVLTDSLEAVERLLERDAGRDGERDDVESGGGLARFSQV